MSGDLDSGFTLGENDIRPGENRVVRAGVTHHLEPKSMAVLVELARTPGETVTRDHLLRAVWPRGYVTDGVLSRCISQLRAILGDNSRSPVLIATVPRRGYRLLAPVKTRAVAAEGVLVLPFQHLAAHGSQDYLADGLTDLLIARLAAALDQRVVSRTTAMTFKSTVQDIALIREKLNVRWMVEGSLFQFGDDLQIVVQLIDVERDAHAWANTWTRPPADVMNVLNDVTRQVATQVRQRIDPLKAAPRAPSGLPAELESRYLQGLHHLSRRAAPSLHRAIACFEEVLASHQDHAPAHAGAALANVLLAHYGAMDVRVAMQRARKFALRALEIDSDNAEALTHLGAIKFFHDWDLGESRRLIDAALERRPNYEIALLLSADILLVQGHYDVSQAQIDLAVDTDPLNVGLLMNAGDLLVLQRRYLEAVRSLEQALEIEPGMRPAHLRKALAFALSDSPIQARASLDDALAIAGEDAMSLEYLALVESFCGNQDAARDAANRLQAIADGGAHVSPWPLARAWAASGQEAMAVSYLRRAFEQRSTSMPFLGVSPVFDKLRKHPQVRDLMVKVGVPALAT